MSKRFREYVWITRGFYVIRFAAALLVSLAYILIAALIQYIFVDLLGESTFNYIVGGLLSLFIGVIFCRYIGSLIFMLVKGWHVAALAYLPKLKRADASAIEVGIRAFNKNLISFGAVYAVRTVINNLLSNFREHLWELFGDHPWVQWFRKSSASPIVEHIAGDILHYGFDATIFYLVRHPGNSVEDVPGRVVVAVKQYLYCLPAIMFTSIKSFLLFRFVPKVLKWLFVVWMFLTQGILAGILISVLMYPLFYVLDNAFFDPLTMTMFIAAYSSTCDKEVDASNPVVAAVNAILEESEGIDSVRDEDPVDTMLPREPPQPTEVSQSAEPPQSPRSSRRRRRRLEGAEAVQTRISSEDELYGSSASPQTGAGQQGSDSSVISQEDDLDALLDELLGDEDSSSREVDEVTPSGPPIGSPGSLADIARGRGLSALRNQSSEGLDDDPLRGQSSPEEDRE